MKSFLSFIFILLVCSGIAGAQDLTISPCDQGGINTALSNVYNSGGGTVYLEAGVYLVTGQVKMGSNTRLTGSPDAIIQVSSSSSQWFTDGVGIIGLISQNFHDIEIDSIQLDGNLRGFPASYADSGVGKHNAERAIDFRASSGAFASNIKIHNLKIYDCFSDGIHIAFANNVDVYDNFVSDCQHSGIYFTSVINGLMESNQVSGITSDCLRFDNCENNIFRYNILYSYTGDSNGAYENGQNGVQIADQGYSHNGGSDKPTTTENIEGYGNVFSNDGLRTIWLDSTGKGVKNVYLHDNTGTTISTNGVSVGNITFANPPTVAMSENIFTSIFDILNLNFTSPIYQRVNSSLSAHITEVKQGNIPTHLFM